MDPTHKIGDRVFWHDPDDGQCSGPGIVTSVDGDVLSVAKDDGGVVECHASEATIQRCAHALALLADARRTCAVCGDEIVPRVRVTYEIVTPESAEDGDVAESGWLDETGTTFDADDLDPEDPTRATYGDVIARFITRDRGSVECSDSPPDVTAHRAPWFTQSDPDVDFRTGEEERRGYHVEGLTADEWSALFVALECRTAAADAPRPAPRRAERITMTAATKPIIPGSPPFACERDGTMTRVALEYPDVEAWCYAQPTTILAWRDTADATPVLKIDSERALLRLVVDPDAALLSFAGITVEREDDNTPIEDTGGDEEAVAWIRGQVAAGNEWAWCEVRVHVEALGFRGSSSWLCGCSYASEAAFRQPGSYFDDLTREALADLRDQIEAAGEAVRRAARIAVAPPPRHRDHAPHPRRAKRERTDVCCECGATFATPAAPAEHHGRPEGAACAGCAKRG